LLESDVPKPRHRGSTPITAGDNLFMVKHIARLMLKMKSWFFIVVAGLFLAVYIAPVYFSDSGTFTSYQIYDVVTKVEHQLDAFQDKNDEDRKVFVIDIDESSLAALASEYGRWPWSRSVMAEFIEYLSIAEPAAIGIDVIYSDPDLNDIDGDEYLNEVVTSLSSVYLSALRLPQHNDKLSAIRTTLLPNIDAKENINEDSTVAMLLPFLSGALESQRFGLTNFAHLLTDDGIVRHYPVAMDLNGYRIPSLASQLARATGVQLPRENQILLNYLSANENVDVLSFNATFTRLKAEDEALLKKLNQAVVIIGSSAPGLFDIKTTPISNETPGVIILASAVENLINNNWYQELNSLPGLFFLILMLLFGLIRFIKGSSVESADAIFIAMDGLALALAAIMLVASKNFADISFASHFALAFYIVCRVFQVIYNQQLRQGRLLIGHKGHAKLDLVCGSYHFETAPGNSHKLKTALYKKSPFIAVSSSIFDTDVGLLAEYASQGGLFYSIVPEGEGAKVQQDIESAIQKFSIGENKVMSTVDLLTLQENSLSSLREVLSEKLPRLLHLANAGK